MKKSIGLLSALVVSTTFIVNCQKAPDKRRVRPSGGSGTGSQSDIVDEKAKLPTKVCSKEIIDAYTKLYSNQTQLDKMTISTHSTDAEKEAKKKLGVETLAKCEEVENLLKGEKNQGCYRDNGVKDLSNAYTASGVHKACKDLAKKLESEVGLESALANEAKADDKAKADTKEVEEKFIGKNGQIFTMSKEARQLVLSGNTDGGRFLVGGEIRSSNTALEQALAASSTVCTFLGEGLRIEENTDATLKIVAISAAEKADLYALKSGFTGKATLLSTEVTQGEDKSIISLLCLNLDAAKLSVEKIEKALGSEIHRQNLAATQQAALDKAAEEKKTKEEQQQAMIKATVGTSETATVSASAVSPQQQNLAAAQAQAAAEAKAKEAQKPAVTLVPATGVSSPAAAAQVEAESKVTKEELASMKEKAERLEKEAKDAEVEVAKLESEKAKAEDIDQAKAKARIARESANSAKAEYEAAAKA